MTVKTEIDIETLLHWAFRDELSKRRLSSAEGIWDRIAEDAQRGGIDIGRGSAQRYPHFGLPDPDAELIEQAIGALEDTVIDWAKSFNAIAAELSGLISVNEIAKPESRHRAPKANWGAAGTKALKAWWGPDDKNHTDKPRDVLMVGGLRTGALVTMHAIKGTRPDWNEEPPRPVPTPAARGPNAMILGECKGKNLYSLGAHCPLKWSPSPLSIISSRADYIAWHAGLTKLSEKLQLAKFVALPPKAVQTPWLGQLKTEPSALPVVPNAHNQVSAWGTLPLTPARGRKLAPQRIPKAGPVRYPLEGEVA